MYSKKVLAGGMRLRPFPGADAFRTPRIQDAGRKPVRQQRLKINHGSWPTLKHTRPRGAVSQSSWVPHPFRGPMRKGWETTNRRASIAIVPQVGWPATRGYIIEGSMRFDIVTIFPASSPAF